MPGVLIQPNPQASPGAQSVHAGIVEAAAQKWGVPSWVLWGVYGAETGFGSLVQNSSAGAVGSFQFEPGTARMYGYPLTNATDPKTFAAQANSAAHYLHDLYQQKGNWDQAISSYNAGPNGAYQAGYVAKVHANGPGISNVKLSNSTWAAIAAVMGIALPVGVAAIGPESLFGALGGGGAAADTTAGGTAGAGIGTAASTLANAAGKLGAGAAITGVFNQAVGDAKYAALLVLALLVGGYMILHGISPKAATTVRVVTTGRGGGGE